MKRKILLMLLCIMMVIPLNSCGVDQQEQEYQQALQDLSDKKYKSAFEHFANLQGYKDSQYYYDSFTFLPLSAGSYGGTYKYIIDYDNKTIQKLNCSSDGTKLYSKTKYIYNDNNFIQKVVETDSGGKESSTIYTYDNSNKLTRMDFSDDSYTILQYDDYNNIIKCSHYYTDRDANNRVSGDIYTYDEHNNLTSYVIFNGDKEQLEETYEYDSNDNCIAYHKIPIFEPDSEGYSKLDYEYSYDFNNQLVVRNLYYSNSDGNDKTKTIYTYDGEHCIMSDYTFEDENKTYTEESYYTYDRYGNCVHEHTQNSEGENKSYDILYELVYWEGGLNDVFKYPDIVMRQKLQKLEYPIYNCFLNENYTHGGIIK